MFRGNRERFESMEDLAALAIEHTLKNGAEFADLRMEDSQGTSILFTDGKTKTVSLHLSRGCGIRAFIGGAWGFAVTNDLSKAALMESAEAASRMAKVAKDRAKTKFDIPELKAEKATERYRCRIRPTDVRSEDKVSFASSLDGSMRKVDERVVSTGTRYDDYEGDRIVANSFGTMIRINEIWTLAACSAWAKSDGVIQRGHEAVGKVGGYELMETEEALGIGSDAANQAVRLVDAKPAPAGDFECILDYKMTGLLAHEAFGHACEADSILAGASVLEDRIDQRVAAPGVTLVDDPTMEDSFGHFTYDWEGVRAKKHVLIDDGILKEYLHNIETGSRTNSVSNGAARAQTYGSPPIIRMSNTYIAGGDWKKDELISDTKQGLLIQGSQYGYVEPSKGQFMFKCDEAYAIRNGELGERYRDASLSGVILEVLNNVTAIADDFRLGDPGYCGKNGQSARVSDGGAHLRVSHVVVGGLV
jgi:TldD protein